MAKGKKETTASTDAVVTVEFLVSPTGKFGLGYNVGEIGAINEFQATELIEAGYAKLYLENEEEVIEDTTEEQN